MTQEEEIQRLQERLSEALERLSALEEQLNQTQEQASQHLEKASRVEADNQLLKEQLEAAHKRIEELEQQKTSPPPAVLANKKKLPAEEKQPRKKREAQYNRARQRSVPTQMVEHRIVVCPDCHLRLGGISLARRREVIDVPPPPAVEVTEHRIYKGWCTGCQKWHEAPVDFSAQVLGQGRIGVRLASMIAYLRTVMRLPLRQLRDVLRDLHGMPVSLGELVELVHRITEYAQPTLTNLKAQIRASPAGPRR